MKEERLDYGDGEYGGLQKPQFHGGGGMKEEKLDYGDGEYGGRQKPQFHGGGGIKEEQLDYGDGEYGGRQKPQFHGGGGIKEEQLDYGDGGYGARQKPQFHGGGGKIPAVNEDELMGDDDEYDDLYNDVNIGEGFAQTLQKKQVNSGPPAPTGNDVLQNQKVVGLASGAPDPGISQPVSIPGIGMGEKDPRDSTILPKEEPKSGFPAGRAFEQSRGEYPGGVPQGARTVATIPGPQTGNVGYQVGPPANILPKASAPSFTPGSSSVPPVPSNIGMTSGPPVPPNQMGIMGKGPVMDNMPPIDNNGPTSLLVGELHWWTTDAELEVTMSQYGRVKEIKFFEERASGKSKGYCQVEFYDARGAASCKDAMNGYVFNGRPCVVTFASAQSLRQMGAGHVKRNQTQSQAPGRGMMNENTGRSGMNQGGGDGGRNNGRGGWGRGGQGMLNRGQGNGGMMRERGNFGSQGMVGAGGMGSGMVGANFGQGIPGPGLGGPAGAMMHQQNLMGTGFDPTYMGRGGPYGGFAAPVFPGMMPSFPSMNTVGLAGVAPHVNPAFFGRGMLPNGMGMANNGGVDGHSAGMWSDAGTGWTGEEQGRTRESSYGGEDAPPDYGYGEATDGKGGRSNASRERDMASERDWPENSDRRHRDDRERDRERHGGDRHREGRDSYRDHRKRDRDYDIEDERRSSSRSHGRMQEEDNRSRSRDVEYGKRRRE